MRNYKRPPLESFKHLIWKPGDSVSKPDLTGSSGAEVEDADNYVIVRDIECTDADGTVFDRHDELWIPKDVERTEELDEDGNNKPKNFTPYNAIVHFEENDCFLPPVCVTLNYLVKIFDAAVERQEDGNYEILDEEFKKVLDRYHSIGEGNFSYHAQNSLVAYGTSEMIHYPKKEEFTSAGGSVDINVGRENIRLGFDKSELQDCLLLDGLKNKGIERFVRQYSGLVEPERLVDLGDYYSWLSGKDKPIKLWFPWNGKNGKDFTATRASWVGCGSDSFNLGAYYDLDDGNADYYGAASRVQSLPPS